MLKESDFVKIHTAVPAEHAQTLRDALGRAGAGEQGDYRHCSGSIKSIGRFTPLDGAHPSIGEVGTPEEVEEEIIQMLCHKNKVKDVVNALRDVHPYEEPAIDIFPRLEIE